MSSLLLTSGDTAPTLTGVCKNGDDPADLTGATATIHIRRPVAAAISRTVTVAAPLTGAWSMTWQTGDLDDVGVYETEVQVTFAGGQIQTFGPDTFTVQAQIA